MVKRKRRERDDLVPMTVSMTLVGVLLNAGVVLLGQTMRPDKDWSFVGKKLLLCSCGIIAGMMVFVAVVWFFCNAYNKGKLRGYFLFI